MIRRFGNFGFVTGEGGEIYSFKAGTASKTPWSPATYVLRGSRIGAGLDYETVNGVPIIPYGPDNDLPGHVKRLLENFYAGEGIMGKKVGLQWGEGPRLYRDAVDVNNVFYRAWTVDPAIGRSLKDADVNDQMLRCLVDLCHLEGFWVKFTRTRGSRLGDGAMAKVEHIPAAKVRFVWPGVGRLPSQAMVADFPDVRPETSYVYPLFDPSNPLKYPVSVAYYSIYTFGAEYYSVPRYVGAFDWIELVGTLAPLLAVYNQNASAISKHIESPQSYWDEQEERIKAECQRREIPYRKQMLEDFKNEAMERFAGSLTGGKNAGKFLHTENFWNPEAEKFEGWKITSIDNKIKDYIDAQVAICRKAEAAATSGFGLDPSLSNLILDTKLGSGSEKLYALKVYNATETAIPDMVLCRPFQQFIDINHPGTDVKIGLYRTVVEAEKNVNPENRVKANA